MSGGFTHQGGVCNATAIGANAAASKGTVVTASGTANTKGSWVQLTAATPADCAFVSVVIFFDGTAYAWLDTASVDIAIGAAGSEIIILPDLMVETGYQLVGSVTYAFPLTIPAGTRIAARAQTVVNTTTVVNVMLTTFESSFHDAEGFAGVDALGFNSASTQGVAITPSATANTMGSYAQIVASTARDYAGLMAVYDYQAGQGQGQMLLDIAVGAGGSEVVLIPSVIAGRESFQNSMYMPFIPVRIPSGTRLAMRGQADAASRTAMGVTLYGVY